MKIIGIASARPGVTQAQLAPHMAAEAREAWRLYQADVIRENYTRTDHPGVVTVFECESVDAAKEVCKAFPLVREGLIDLEFIPVGFFKPWAGNLASYQLSFKGGTGSARRRLMAKVIQYPKILRAISFHYVHACRCRHNNRRYALNRTVAATTLLALLSAPAWARQPAPGATMPMKPGATMPGMAMPMAAPAADGSPSTTAFKAADEKMMRDMDRPMTGNADQDFVAGMLPHHGGAVDMAMVELRYGKDPEMRRLARGIIAAQEKEITQMRAWQRKHAKP